MSANSTSYSGTFGTALLTNAIESGDLEGVELFGGGVSVNARPRPGRRLSCGGDCGNDAVVERLIKEARRSTPWPRPRSAIPSDARGRGLHPFDVRRVEGRPRGDEGALEPARTPGSGGRTGAGPDPLGPLGDTTVVDRC